MSERRAASHPAGAAGGWAYGAAVTRITSLLTFGTAGYLLYWGWTHRERHYLTPQEGTGYLLGIVGASLMLVLTLYPARKHLRFMRHFGPTRHWFRMHMLLGIAGPIAILYHCNFSTGATNSNIALFSMIVVASSGLVGRYLYAAIHEGLYGQHVRFDDVRDSWLETRRRMQAHGHVLETLEARLAVYEAPLEGLRRTLLGSLARLAVSVWQAAMIRAMARAAVQDAKGLTAAQQREVMDDLHERLAAAAKVYRYNAVERMFGLWHLLHLPLFFMLLVTGTIHVVAVNLY